MAVVDLKAARRARAEASERGGVARHRRVKIPGHPELYGQVMVTRRAGARGGRTLLIVKRRKGAHRGNDEEA